MKILFMGTPDFALVSLRALCEAGYDIVGVVTRQDKPKGRGYALAMSPVKEYALERGIPVYQPASLRHGELDSALRELEPELIAVAAYGRILPSEVLYFPKYGSVCVHGSLLPAYRGAAPIQRALINGERKVGVTIMQMDEGIDTGDMLLSAETEVMGDDNFETVHDRLAFLGAEALLKVTAAIASGDPPARVKQDDSLSNYAAKIEKTDCEVDFTLDSERVFNLIRGLSPAPLAFSRINGRAVKLVSARRAEGIGVPGTVLSVSDVALTVACGSGAVAITSLIPEGKKRMTAKDFINGRGAAVGDRFEEKNITDSGKN